MTNRLRFRKNYDGRMVPEVAIILDQVASIAKEMAERWGMVAALPDGEDTSGRQKLRIMTPEELVERACTVAELLWLDFEKRGWTLDIPEFVKTESYTINLKEEKEDIS